MLYYSILLLLAKLLKKYMCQSVCPYIRFMEIHVSWQSIEIEVCFFVQILLIYTVNMLSICLQLGYTINKWKIFYNFLKVLWLLVLFWLYFFQLSVFHYFKELRYICMFSSLFEFKILVQQSSYWMLKFGKKYYCLMIMIYTLIKILAKM